MKKYISIIFTIALMMTSLSVFANSPSPTPDIWATARELGETLDFSRPTGIPSQTRTPRQTPQPNELYNEYYDSFFMFSSGWWDDRSEFSKAYGLIDTIESGGYRAKIWLIVGDVAYVSGYEVWFSESLIDAGVTYGDILLMYCRAMEPTKDYTFRARANYFEILTQYEANIMYDGLEDFIF